METCSIGRETGGRRWVRGQIAIQPPPSSGSQNICVHLFLRFQKKGESHRVAVETPPVILGMLSRRRSAHRDLTPLLLRCVNPHSLTPSRVLHQQLGTRAETPLNHDSHLVRHCLDQRHPATHTSKVCPLSCRRIVFLRNPFQSPPIISLRNPLSRKLSLLSWTPSRP
jgi:hypothetical protein